MSILLRRCLSFVITLAILSVVAAAQTSSLRGRVTDPQGGAVVGATVTLSASSLSSPRTTRTTVDGSFSVDGLASGTYTLHIESPGFQPADQPLTVPTNPDGAVIVLQIAGVSETVAVAAPKLEEELPQVIQRSGARVQTITSAQIENGGYYDVAQALQALVPGLFITPKAGPFDYVAASLQGSRTNEILWLVDGVRISNRLYNSTTPLDTIPANMIERIEVIEGGQGLFYGTQAVAGAINVVTKSFTDNTSGRLQTGFDTNKGGHVSAFTRDTDRGNRFVLFGSKDKATGFRSFPSNEYQASTTDRNRGYDAQMIGGKYAYDFTEAARFSAMYQLNDVTLDNLRPARSSTSQVGGLAAAYNERLEHIFSSKLDYTPRPDVQLFFKGYYHQWDSQWSERRNVIGAPGSVSVISDREFWGFKDYGANVLARLTPTRGFEYFGGYDFQNYSGRDDVLLVAQRTERVNALFGQVRTTPDLLKKATLAVGARYSSPTHSKSATVWNVSSRYDFSNDLFARASVGTAFRYPDAYELFAIDPTCCFGNPNLKPESSTNFNGSVGRRFSAGDKTVTVEAIGFYRRVTDLIVDVDDGSGETTITMNQPDVVKVQGISLVGSAAVTSAVSGSIGYTYNRTQKNELSGGYTALPGLPSNVVDGSIDVHPTTLPFGATLTVNSVGRIVDTVAGFGSVPSGDYAVVDLAGRVFLDRRRQHRVNIRLENLFDKTYTTLSQRGIGDASTGAFVVHNLGVPRTFHLSYAYSF
jgi:outer membrane cobalamin receptor